MLLHLNAGLQARIPGVTFGFVTINGVNVREGDERLWQQLEAVAKGQSERYTLEQLASYKQIAAVRGMQRAFGFDPTRYRPSSEALLRRVLKGQGLYQINSAVDVNNWCSLEFLLPMCVYDLAHVEGQIVVRLGEPGEAYPGIGRQMFQIEQKVIIADERGVMGTTVSDSERTKVTTQTHDIFLAIYAPAGSECAMIARYAALAGERMITYNGGHISDVQALTVA